MSNEKLLKWLCWWTSSVSILRQYVGVILEMEKEYLRCRFY